MAFGKKKVTTAFPNSASRPARLCQTLALALSICPRAPLCNLLLAPPPPHPLGCQLLSWLFFPCRWSQGWLYLENGVHSRQLAVHGNAKHLRHQMCAQKVGDRLMDVEVAGTHPDFGQKPVIFCIRREKNWVLVSRGLVELVC